MNWLEHLPGPLRAGWVKYFPLATNTALRGTPTGWYFQADGRSNWDASAVIDSDGRFKLAVPPGPGVLLVNAHAGSDEFWGMGTVKESEGAHLLAPYVKLTTRFENDGGPEGSAQSFPGFNRPIPVEMPSVVI